MNILGQKSKIKKEMQLSNKKRDESQRHRSVYQ